MPTGNLARARQLQQPLGARIIRFFFAGLYARGREVIWIVAILTMVAAIVADLTGRLLPWDAGGYWTTVRAREVTDAMPILGTITTFLAGGTALDSLAVTRYYVLHIAVLPIALLVLFYAHFASVRRVGLSPVESPQVARSLRVALYDILLLLIFMVGGLITFAVLFPYPFDAMADPFVTPPNARPPWYLLAPHALMEVTPSYLPGFLRGLLPEAIFVVVLLVPFLDRSAGEGTKRRRHALVGVASLVIWVGLTCLGYLLEVKR